MNTGAMLALMLQAHNAAALLAQLPPALTPESDLHLTLAFLGQAESVAPLQEKILAALQPVVASATPITGLISGLGRFNIGDQHPLYASFDSPALPAFRQQLINSLTAIIPVDQQHGFTPHITLSYLQSDAPTPDLQLPPLSLSFNTLTLAIGDQRINVPFAQPRLLTSIKALDDWTLDVLGVPFSGPIFGRDLDGQRFTPDTKLHLDRFNPLVLYYHAFDENGQPQGEPEEIGQIISHEQRPDGWWFKILLDQANDYAHRVWDAAQKNLARASSGTAEHLMRIADNGEILNWPMVELSLLDAVEGRQPVNAYAVAVPAVKAHYHKANRPLPIPLRVGLAGRPVKVALDSAPKPIRSLIPQPKPIKLENLS